MMRPMRSLTIFLVGSASTFAAWDLFRFFGSLTACLARIHFSGFTGLGNMPRDLPGPATRFTILLGFFSRFGKGRLGSFEFNWSWSFKDGKFLFAGDDLSCPFSRFGNDLCRITDKCFLDLMCKACIQLQVCALAECNRVWKILDTCCLTLVPHRTAKAQAQWYQKTDYKF